MRGVIIEENQSCTKLISDIKTLTDKYRDFHKDKIDVIEDYSVTRKKNNYTSEPLNT